ncbi:SemiSWEET family transporter [Vallicoccus soli]|uniref:PQ-loop repeat-containing protein n=1 Tax=Vallicoccus soli TaxID=2339232 RepID=A0A3A3YXE8_9ACTN|nr:SemiSWEET family transporter [Vallicoccus soli]RJK96349.1 hypothetical protein D5H78_08900 [Vallicoccus soli]
MLPPLDLPVALPALPPLVPVLGTLASALSMTCGLPQLWRTCGRGEVAGLPPARFWLGVAMSACWLVYGVVTLDPAQLVTNAVVGAMGVAQLVALLRLSAEARETASSYASGLAAWLGLVGAAAVSGGAGAVGLLGAVVGVGSTLPQLLHLLRERGADVSGISLPGLVATVACAATWAAYGALRGEAAVCVPAALQTGVHLWTLSLVAAARRAAQCRPETTSATLATVDVEPPLASSSRSAERYAAYSA